MINYRLNVNTATAVEGDAREWALCEHYGVERNRHDNKTYMESSDLVVGDKRISIKSARFTLMSGAFCKGLNTVSEIWERYEATTHSNTAAYVTKDYEAFEMNMDDFKEFVLTFGSIQKESEKNGGGSKVRCKSESKALLRWLRSKVA